MLRFCRVTLATLLLFSPALAQQCSFRGTFTSATTGTPFQNNTTNPNCNAWALTWNSTGFTGLSIQLQGSDDGSTYTAFSGSSTILVGTNPGLTLSGAVIIQASANLAFLEVKVNSVTGSSGGINYQVYGYNGVTPAAKGSGGGSGGGSLIQTWTAGGTIAAGQLVCPSRTGSPATAIVCPLTVVGIPPAINASILGIAQTGASSGGSLQVIVAGPATCAFDSINAPIAGHLASYSLTTAGTCQDSGNGGGGFGVPIAGVVMSTGLSGSTQNIYMFGSGNYGSAITPVAPLKIVNPSSGNTFKIQAGNATSGMGTGTQLAFATGPFTPGDCLNVDAATGSIADTGSACASGSTAFNQVLSGTNNSATMQVHSGSVIEPTPISPGGIYATQVVDGNDLPAITVGTPAGPAVDHLNVTGSVAANPATVRLAATGSDSNINLFLASLGSGTLLLNNANFSVDSTGAMLVGTGTSINPSGTGVINATELSGLSIQGAHPVAVATTIGAAPVNGNCANWNGQSVQDAGVACDSLNANAVAKNAANVTTAAFGLDASASTVSNAVKVPVGAGMTTTANGAIGYDSTANNFHAAQNGADANLASYKISPGNGNCVEWLNSAGMIDLGDAGFPCGSGGAGGGITIYSGTPISYSGTQYFAIGGGAAPSATESDVEAASPATATISNLFVQLSAPLGGGNSVVYTWRDGGSPQTLTCTISGASATSCSDTSHSFSAAAGDLLDIQTVATGTILVTPVTVMTSAFGTSGVGVTSVTASSPLAASVGTTPNITAITGILPGDLVQVNANGVIPPQLVPYGGFLTYYMQNTASAVATYKQLLPTPFTPKTTLSTGTLGTGATTLQNWITQPSVPNLTYIPAGTYIFHMHAARTAGTKGMTLTCQFVESSSTGVDIAVIGTSEASAALTAAETEYTLDFVNGNVYTLGSSASRITARVIATGASGGSDATVALYYGDEADSHISLPSNAVDSTNFVPYTGAVSDLNLGSHALAFTATAGTGGVTQNLIAAKDTSNPTRYILPAAGSCGAGIAASTATVGNTFPLYSVAGEVLTMVADGAITAGDILTGGSSTPGRVADTGQTTRALITSNTCTIGVALASATVGNTVSVKYDGVGTFGTLLPNPSASTLGGVESQDCGAQFVSKINTDGTITCATPPSGGTMVTPSTFAAIGACSTTAFVKLLSNSYYNFANCDGASTLTYYMDGKVVTLPPAASNWTTVSGGTVAVNDSNGAVVFSAAVMPQNLSGAFLAVPVAPYTRTFAIRALVTGNSAPATYLETIYSVGWTNGTNTSSANQSLWRQLTYNSGGSAILASEFGIVSSTNFSFAGSVANAVFTPPLTTDGTVWVRLADDNTNRTVAISLDGLNFQQLYSTARNTPFTPTNFGVMVGCASCSSGANGPFSITVLALN